jgi:hypothetical protein
MIEKKTREITVWEETTTQEYYVETVTEVKEIEWNIDQIESQITQKSNTIIGLQWEIDVLEAKKQEILNLKK